MTPYESLRQQQLQTRLGAAQAEAAAALQALRERGVVVGIIGSLANGNFNLHSDVDFLIEDAASLTDGQIYWLITEHVRSVPVDIVYAARQSAQALALLRGAGQASTSG